MSKAAEIEAQVQVHITQLRDTMQVCMTGNAEFS